MRLRRQAHKEQLLPCAILPLQAKRGPQKAICAVAASILTAIYHILKDGTEHHDLGSTYFERHPPEIKANRLIVRLKKLGFSVQLQPILEAA